jgi:hypothetical protein
MSQAQPIRSSVTATTDEVLPRFGVAFLVDEQSATWAVTRSTDGPGLDALRIGQRVQLTLERRGDFSMVRSYDLLN